jgi:hypothetical protein
MNATTHFFIWGQLPPPFYAFMTWYLVTDLIYLLNCYKHKVLNLVNVRVVNGFEYEYITTVLFVVFQQ